VSENEVNATEVKVTVRPNGPLRVEGPIKLVDAQGGEWNIAGKPGISLCRCGASANKPFCDGSHNKIGFQAAEVAPPATPAE
jgi:CDGSH-type Zn-finger protein